MIRHVSHPMARIATSRTAQLPSLHGVVWTVPKLPRKQAATTAWRQRQTPHHLGALLRTVSICGIRTVRHLPSSMAEPFGSDRRTKLVSFGLSRLVTIGRTFSWTAPEITRMLKAEVLWPNHLTFTLIRYSDCDSLPDPRRRCGRA